MILIRLLHEDKGKIERIAERLLKEHLVIDINLKDNIERLELKKGKLIKRKIILMTAKTKALLFPLIEDLIKEFSKEDMPEIYSLPIIHMDWEQSYHLLEVVKKV